MTEWAAVQYPAIVGFSGPAAAGRARGLRRCRDCAAKTRWVTELDKQRESGRQKRLSWQRPATAGFNNDVDDEV